MFDTKVITVTQDVAYFEDAVNMKISDYIKKGYRIDSMSEIATSNRKNLYGRDELYITQTFILVKD